MDEHPHAPPAIRTFREFAGHRSWTSRARGFLRDAAIWTMSLRSRPPTDRGWIRFPYYHHVFDDEREGFDAQLRYMRDFGEFVSIDDAIGILESDAPVDGRYFCITFDDGFRNCLTNALPILLEHAAPAAFFIPTAFIRASAHDADAESPDMIHRHGESAVEFLDWDEVREMVAAGMTMGSHTVHHRLLASLTHEEVEEELRVSKDVIEQQLGVPCDHFGAPVGRPGIDFDPERAPKIAEQMGYRSFLTTQRGSCSRRPHPMAVERDHLVGAWGLYQTRYFLGR